jgi:hypothetical protein
MAMINWADFGMEDAKAASNIVPAGWYQVEVTKADVKLTKAAVEDGVGIPEVFQKKNPTSPKGSVYGAMFVFGAKILTGEYAGRFVNLNIWFAMSKDNVGAGQISEIAAACGFKRMPSDISELVGNQLNLRVKIEAGSGSYADKNSYGGSSVIDTEINSYQPARDVDNGGSEINDDDIPF